MELAAGRSVDEVDAALVPTAGSLMDGGTTTLERSDAVSRPVTAEGGGGAVCWC